MSIDLNRRFAVGGFFLTVGNAVQAVSGLAASLLLARWIGPDAFGRFAVAHAIVGLTLTVLTLRLQILIIRSSTAEMAGRRADLYFNALVMETLVAGVVSLACLALLGLWSIWAVALALGQCLAHWVGVNRSFYERSMPYGHLALVETAAVVASHGFAVAMALLGAGDAALYMREIVGGLLLGLFLAATGGLTYMPLRRLSLVEIADIVREGRSIWLDGLLEGGFQRLTTLAASGLGGGERQTGYFFMAQSLVSRPHQLVAPIVTRAAAVWLRDAPEIEVQRRRCRWLLVAAALPLVVAAALLIGFASPLVAFVLGEGWVGAAPVLVAMSGVVLFLTPFEILRSFGFVIMAERAILRARAAQYLVFAATVACGIVLSSDIVFLGIAVSLAFAAAFLMLVVLLVLGGSR